MNGLLFSLVLVPGKINLIISLKFPFIILFTQVICFYFVLTVNMEVEVLIYCS